MADMDSIDAVWKVECGLQALEGIEMLLGVIYKSGQDLHCINPSHLSDLIGIVRQEIELGFQHMPR